MAVAVKICGITNIDDALDAIDLGADFLGFNFYPDSKRYINPKNLIQFIDEIPYSIKKVGIFVNADPQYVIDIVTELNIDILQFHGDEAASYCNQFARPFIKATRPLDAKDLSGLEEYAADYYLVDSFVQGSYGGSGVVSNWDLARKIARDYKKPIMLSGGLNSENIEMAIGSVKPWGVDVASGVESSPGKKDYHKIEEFIKKAKSVTY